MQNHSTVVNLKRQTFDYFYMFVMVIYMAQMSYATKALFSVSGDASIIGILIPNILTLILILRNKRKITGNWWWLGFICVLVFVWIAVIAAKFGVVEARSGMYTIYYIIVAYIQVRIFGKSLFLYFEDIMVLMAKITTVMWLLGVLLPPVDQIYTMFPLSTESDYRTMDGYNILYLFCWNHASSTLIPRNAGFAWEPGRYAIMLVLAILVNLYRRGIRFFNNSSVIWLLVALASTMSTTGFVVVMVLYLYFAVKRINFQNIFVVLIVFVPLVYAVSQLDFMGEKIKKQIESFNSPEKTVEGVQWGEKNDPNLHIALDRFISIFFEFQNIKQEPITGYGPTTNQSFFSKFISEEQSMTGGLLQMFGRYGIPLGIFFYFILFRSSSLMANSFGTKKKWGLFIYALVSSISYPLFCVAIFMSIWFYGVFDKGIDKRRNVGVECLHKKE